MTTPTALYVWGIGPSHFAAWLNAANAPVELGNRDGRSASALPGGLHGINGIDVWREELRAEIPGLPIAFSSTVRAGVGIGAWASTTAITTDMQDVLTSFIGGAAAHPSAKAILLIFACVAEWQGDTAAQFEARYRLVCNAALTQWAAAHPGRPLEVWIFTPGNRWNVLTEIQPKIRMPEVLAGRIAVDGSPPIPGVFASADRTAGVIGDHNNPGDGIHYPQGTQQRFGRSLALDMLEAWGLIEAGPRAVYAWQSAPRTLKVRVQHAPGLWFGGAEGNLGTDQPWRTWNPNGGNRSPASVTYDRTWRAQGFTDAVLGFSADHPAGGTVHCAVNGWLAFYPVGQDIQATPHAAPNDQPMTRAWDDLIVPRRAIRPLRPSILPMMATAPADPVTQPPPPPPPPPPLTLEERMASAEARIAALEARP